MRKPFFRRDRQCWYVKDPAGKFVRLDPDEKKAFTIWERMRRLADFKQPDATVEAIFEAFLRDIQLRITAPRFARYTYFCEAFALYFGASRKAREVSGSDVLRWVRLDRIIHGEKSTWSIARQRDAGQALKRAIEWAVRRGYLPWTDVLELRFEAPEPREELISYEMHRKLVEGCRGQKRSRPFGLVLIALRLSGARPIQVRSVEAANFHHGAWVFRKHKSQKKTNKALFVRLGPCLHTLTRILASHRPTGPLFRTALGKAWSKDGIVHRFDRLRETLKIEGVSAYSYRHSYATEALESGLDLATVAALLGHTDTAMVARVYGHLEKRSDHMSQAVETIAKARNAK